MNCYKAILLFSLGILLSGNLLAQKQDQERIDSLHQVVQQTTNERSRAMELAELSFAYFPVDPAVGLRYGKESLALAVRLKYARAEARACNALGANYWARHEFLQAQDYYLRALKINSLLKEQREIARNIHNIADVYAEFDLDKALSYYFKALAIVSRIGDRLAVLGFQANIADIYERQQKYALAAVYLSKSVRLAGQLHRTRDGAAYQSLLSVIEGRMGHYQQALTSGKAALAVFETIAAENPRKDDVARTLLNLAVIYQQCKDDINALRYNFKAATEFLKLRTATDQGYAAECYANIGRIYLNDLTQEKSPDRTRLVAAKSALKKAVQLSTAIKQWSTLTVVLKDLATVQRLAGEPQQAFQSLELYAIFKDSLYNADRNRSIALRQRDFEYSHEKDSLNNLNRLQAGRIKLLDEQRALAQLRARQQWLFFVIAFILLCLIGIFFIYQHRIARIRFNNALANEQMAKELQAAKYKRNLNQNTLATLLSQMNPHFIFNALNTVQSFIYADQKKRASEYLGKFADLTRKILDNSRAQVIPLAEELTLLNLYLDIEKARFGDDLQVELNIAPNIDAEHLFLPPMLVQPFVENAIKHGLMHNRKDKRLAIDILLGENEQALTVKIDDNGIGRQASMALNAERAGHQPFANDANRKRIDLINDQLLDQNIRLEIIDKRHPDGTAAGTTIILQIPGTLIDIYV